VGALESEEVDVTPPLGFTHVTSRWTAAAQGNMSLSLPTKTARPTSENLKLLQAGLTSVISGHPQSIQPWTFYEELDQYLGPWGNKGYPIGLRQMLLRGV
jgi:hypothetical protein